MLFSDKIQILIKRNNITKVQFADKVGITYRALANYLNSTRKPRAAVMEAIAKELNVTPEFLMDDDTTLALTSEEKFIYMSSPKSTNIPEAINFITETKGLFAGNDLTEDDKQALFTCLTEIYFDAKAKNIKI